MELGPAVGVLGQRNIGRVGGRTKVQRDARIHTQRVERTEAQRQRD